MTSDETKNYIDQRLHELGLALQLDAGGYEKIHRFTNGTESGVNQLCFKLASLTAESDEREVTTERVTKAIDELARIDDMMRRATKSDVRQADEELERSSIDQLAAMLEANAAVASAAADTYAPPRPTTRPTKTKRAAVERRPKILIVNESKTTRALLVKALTPDFECIETADADDAWRRLVHQADIELVITDVRPHDRAQYDLIGRVRSASAPAHLIGLPIIAMATTEDANAKQRALVAGANDVIAMNTSAGELKARVSARYKASRVAPQYGAAAPKPVAGERTAERKKTAEPSSAPRRVSRPVTSTIAALAPGPLESVRRPFLNTPELMRRVPAGPSRFLAWLYKVSSTTTVTLSATILVVVLLAAIMYVNRTSDSPSAARAPTPPVNTQPTPSSTPSAPTASQPAPGEPTAPLAAAPLSSERAPADTKNKTASKDEPRRESASALPTPGAQARAETPSSAESPATVPRASSEPTLSARRPAELDSQSTAAAAAPATPLPGDNAVARGLDTGADTDSARTAAVAKPPVERLTRDDLATLLKRFTYVYEAGDIEQFMNLFAVNARTNDRVNRDGIRQDYETLFRTTDLRQFKLSHINWEVDSNQAHGWGNFEVTVRRAGDQDLHNYSGSLTLYVERVEGRPRIVRLYHGQRRAGS